MERQNQEVVVSECRTIEGRGRAGVPEGGTGSGDVRHTVLSHLCEFSESDFEQDSEAF